VFHAYANGVSGPLIFTNSAGDFRHVIHQHHIASGLTAVYPRTAIAIKPTSTSSSYTYFGYSCSNVPLTSPFQEESYLIPPPYAGFHAGYLKKIVYASTSSSMCSGSWPTQYITPLLRARDAVTLDGFSNYNYFPTPPFSTTEPVIHSGLGPFSWYGKFFVYSSGYIFALSDQDYAYASQTRDVRPPTASGVFPYELYRGGTLLQSGTLQGYGGYFSSLTPGIYTLKLTMNNFTVNGAPGLATATTTFDMTLGDPAPPALSQFRLRKNGEPTDTISGGELLQFEVIDDSSGIAGAVVQYNRGDGWVTLPQTNPSGTIYEAAMPAPLVPNTPVSIRIVATDTYNNSFTFETQVASSAADTYFAPNDFDGDSISDIGVYRPDNGYWYIFGSSTQTPLSIKWGIDSDKPVPGDYDGDGAADVAVWRPESGMWYILRSNDGGYTATGWGLPEDKPVPGDYDGDGKTDIAVYRPGSGMWFILHSSDGGYTATGWGLPEDKPVPGDYDGDKKTDIAVYRPSSGVWYMLRSSDGGYTATGWGLPNDTPDPADYDGDGITDVTVWRPENGYWFIRTSGTPNSYSVRQWGINTDIPLPAIP
jgi:hypothetical protein